MKDEVLATVSASTPRRWLGVSMLAALGGLLIYTALVRPPAVIGWQIFLLAIGGISLWGAERMYRATAARVELTREVLRVTTGEIIAPLAHISSVDRSMFVFKPSNGFILRLNTGAPGRWAPGLWWRFGRRVGIGGVTPGAQSKVMADILAVMLKERDEGAR
ncbi:MAG: hypothetical protein RIG84_01360 [Roseovarius sp.]